jgi:ABC-2 type transport system permease protein
MNAALLIARKDLRQRLRDRSAIVLGFVAPLVIAALMSVAFKGTESFHTTVDVVDQDHSHLSQAFVGMLSSPDVSAVVTIRRTTSVSAARADVDSGRVGAAIVIPPSFVEAAHGGSTAPVTVLASVDHALDAHLAESLTLAFAAQVNADRLSVATATAGHSRETPVALAEASSRLRLPISVASADSSPRALTALGYYAPAMGIFFMFFAIGFGARGYFLEANEGTLDRILAAPVRARSVLLGKSLATFVYGLGSLSTMAVVTSVAFGAYWGPPVAVAAIVLAMSCALVALTAFVTAVARTDRQADGLASIVTFGLVLLGGNFIVLSSAPALMRHLALATPNGWALRGITDLSTGASPWPATVQPVLAILLFTAAVGVLALALGRRAARR